MAQRHKWADVIIAFAEGKAIQNKSVHSPSKWYDAPDLTCIDSDNLEYRIKPEKKTGWINVYSNNHLATIIFASKSSADFHGGSRIACIQIEYEEGQGL